jgi:aminopeptidase YwaD
LKKEFSILFALLLFSSFLFAQNIARVNQVTDSLCAPYMNGRGYTNKGDKIAANFIKNQFDKAGLKYFKDQAFQKFNLDVNVFEREVSLKIDGKELKVGEDFIVHASSPSSVASGKIIYLDSATIHNPNSWLLQRKIEKSIVAYRAEDEQAVFKMPKTFLDKIMQAHAYLVISKKLTHWISKSQSGKPKLLILANKFDEKARKASWKIHAQMRYGYKTQNVIGYLEGTEKPDSFLVFTAHYDHLGNMGEAYFPGANDNASGVAMLIELANYYAQNPPKFSVAFIAFGAEEAGLVGSRYYTALPFFPLQSIKFLTNLDLFATGEKGMTVVNGSIFKKEFELLKSINADKNYLSNIATRGEAANSDHYFFYLAGVRCFFMYLQGAWTNYHDVADKTPIPYSKFKESFLLIKDFNNALMNEK